MSELFTTVMADPGWQYNDNLRMSSTKRGSRDQYKTTMTVEEICDLYTPSRIEYESRLPSFFGQKQRHTLIPGRLFGQFELADTGFLWLWATAAVLLDGSAAAVCRAWGYEPKQIVPWVKGRIENLPGEYDAGIWHARFVPQIGMGHVTRGCAEYIIVATRGKYTSLVKDHGQPGVLLEARRGHSRKPDGIYSLIEKICPGPYLELFARQRREGWTSYGDELVDDPKITCPACMTGHCAHHKRPAPLPIHTLLIIDDGKIEEHHDVLPDDGLEGQWPTE